MRRRQKIPRALTVELNDPAARSVSKRWVFLKRNAARK